MNLFSRQICTLGLVAMLLAGSAVNARAQEPVSAEPSADEAPPVRDADQKRDIPDLDNREDAPVTAAEALLWGPRVVLFPVYVVTEYVIRYPLGALVTAAEEGDWPRILVDFFTFNDEGSVGVIPTLFYEFGFKPSVGLYFFYDDLFFDGNDFRLHGAFGGVRRLYFRLKDRVRLGTTNSIVLDVIGETRNDYSFRGVGPEADAPPIRYQSTTWDAGLTFNQSFWRNSKLSVGTRFAFREFGAGTCCDQLSISDAVARGDLDEAPPGYEAGGYTVIKESIALTIDSREGRRSVASGFRLQTAAEHAWDPAAPETTQWINYSAGLGAFLDTAYFRTIGLTLQVMFADPLGTDPVPFTDLVQLGGNNPMRNLRDGRLVGHSAAVASVEYVWPIWIWMDGKVEFSVGNVFDEHLSNFEPGLLRWGMNVGVATTGVDSAFEILVGIGSNPFDEGGGVDQVRFFLGTHSGL